MKLLLHICCAPCANRPIASLQEQGHEVTGFWYNPNIHPFTEYRSRRNTVRDYLQEIGLPLIEQNDYGPSSGRWPPISPAGASNATRCA